MHVPILGAAVALVGKVITTVATTGADVITTVVNAVVSLVK